MGMTYIKSESLSMQRMNMIQAREPRWLHSSRWNFRQSLGKIKIENQMLGFFFSSSVFSYTKQWSFIEATDISI